METVGDYSEHPIRTAGKQAQVGILSPEEIHGMAVTTDGIKYPPDIIPISGLLRPEDLHIVLEMNSTHDQQVGRRDETGEHEDRSTISHHGHDYKARIDVDNRSRNDREDQKGKGRPTKRRQALVQVLDCLLFSLISTITIIIHNFYYSPLGPYSARDQKDCPKLENQLTGKGLTLPTQPSSLARYFQYVKCSKFP